MAEPVEEDDLDRAGDRDRSERTEHAGELGSDQHGDQDHERGELHRPAVDDRLENVVLDLLVDDEEHDDDDSGGNGVQERDRSDDDRGDRRACERDQVEDADHEPERDREGHAHDREHDRRERPGDEADQRGCR